MEIIRGKQTSFIDKFGLDMRLAECERIHIDIGTGDGRFVQHVAQTESNGFAIGIDSCRENLRKLSRRAPVNSLFVIANAQDMPSELCGLATQMTINFPWGSLLEGLLTDDPALWAGLARVAQFNTGIEIRLNAGALARAGWAFEEGSQRVRQVLVLNGFSMRSPSPLSARDLSAYPSTWAKRLAFGRDPRAIYLQGIKQANAVMPSRR
jgi:16S rRNA (adenine(1408)-N(1))-methyltransferase